MSYHRDPRLAPHREMTRCPRCEGSGHEPDADPTLACLACRGQGEMLAIFHGKAPHAAL